MPGKRDETGKVYGKLSVLEDRGPNKNGSIQWLCRCACGKEVLISGEYLRKGETKSCGCLRKSKKGISNHPLYKTWYNMVGRCHTESHPRYKGYGGRGIYVHASWRSDFHVFAEWVEENLGSKAVGFTLDRIDANGHYVPGNLRWASSKQQMDNRNPRLSQAEESVVLLFLKPVVFEYHKENKDTYAQKQESKARTASR